MGKTIKHNDYDNIDVGDGDILVMISQFLSCFRILLFVLLYPIWPYVNNLSYYLLCHYYFYYVML